MSISLNQDEVQRVIECAVCGSRQLESAIDLPQLPLTALYSPQPPASEKKLLICTTCGQNLSDLSNSFHNLSYVLYKG